MDSLGSAEPACSHPELLDDLARQFVAHRFDQKFLIRALAGSQAYQRTSRLSHDTQRDPRHFARAAVPACAGTNLPMLSHRDRLPASRAQPARSGQDPEFGVPSAEDEFLAHFGDLHDEPIAAQTSMQQALFLMNDSLTDDAPRPDRQPRGGGRGKLRTLPAQQIEDLYLAALSRPPRPEESRTPAPLCRDESPGT